MTTNPRDKNIGTRLLKVPFINIFILFVNMLDYFNNQLEEVRIMFKNINQWMNEIIIKYPPIV